MKVIPKFLNKGKLPQIRIGNRWVDLESKGNGELTAGGRSYTVKKDSKSTSATGDKELVVTPKENKVIDKNKVRENNKKVMSQHRSAFNGSDILYPVKKGFEVVGRGLYNFGQGVERAASQVSPYGSMRPTNPNWMEAPTPITDATFLYVLPATAPSRLVGTLRTGMAPWNPENPGFGDEDVNLLFDVVAGPKIIPAEMRLIRKGAGKTFKYALKAFSEERPAIDMSNNIDLSHIKLTEPLLSDLFQSDASSKVIFKSPALTVTLAIVDDFWKKVGNLTEKEMVELGFMRPYPGTNLHVVIMDGKPMGSYERIYRPNKRVVPVIETPKAKSKSTRIIMGPERDAQLEKSWKEGEEFIADLKAKHPISTISLQFEDVTNLTLQEQAQSLLSKEGLIELPILRLYLKEHPEQLARVERIAEGKEGIPTNPETGKPDIITAYDKNGNPVSSNDISLASVLAYFDKNNAKIGSRSMLTRDEPFLQTFRGSQPRLSRETLLPNGDTSNGGKASNGNIIFGTGDLMSAVNYAQPLTRNQFLYVMKFLLELGMPITKANIDYGIAVLDNIINKQISEGVKLGSLSEKFHHGLEVARTSPNYGAGKLDVRRMPNLFELGSKPNPEEWSGYVSDMVRYNRFFGPNQGYGGLRTLLMRRHPNSVIKINALEQPFNALPNVLYNGKTYTDIMQLEEAMGTNSGFMGADVFKAYNPTLMNTYISPKGTYFYGFGLKKGGKLLKRPKIKVTFSK